MAAHQSALAANARPLREFFIHLRSATEYRTFTALATSSGEALCDALNDPALVPPVAASAHPARHSTH